MPSSGDEPATPDLESDVLTTRPTRLKTANTLITIYLHEKFECTYDQSDELTFMSLLI